MVQEPLASSSTMVITSYSTTYHSQRSASTHLASQPDASSHENILVVPTTSPSVDEVTTGAMADEPAPEVLLIDNPQHFETWVQRNLDKLIIPHHTDLNYIFCDAALDFENTCRVDNVSSNILSNDFDNILNEHGSIVFILPYSRGIDITSIDNLTLDDELKTIINSKMNLSQFDLKVSHRVNLASSIDEQAKAHAAANLLSLLTPVTITKTNTNNGPIWTGHITNQIVTGDDDVDRIDETFFAIIPSINGTLHGKNFATTTFIPIAGYHDDKLKYHHTVRENWCTFPKGIHKKKPSNKWLMNMNAMNTIRATTVMDLTQEKKKFLKQSLSKRQTGLLQHSKNTWVLSLISPHMNKAKLF